MVDANFTPDRLPEEQRATIEEPYFDRLAELRLQYGMNPEEALAIYTLGFRAGTAIASAEFAYTVERGKAVNSIGPEPSVASDGETKKPEQLEPPLTYIADVPVATDQDIRWYATNVLGRNNAAAGGLSRTLIMCLTEHKLNWSPKKDGPRSATSAAQLVYESLRFFDQRKQEWDGASTVHYIDLAGLYTLAKAMLELPVHARKIQTGVPGLTLHRVTFIAGFLNHRLQLDPPLRVREEA